LVADSFGALATLAAGDRTLELVRLDSLAPEYVWGAGSAPTCKSAFFGNAHRILTPHRLDPVAALVVAVAVREGVESWRGNGCCGSR
jgi:hypothetical protein